METTATLRRFNRSYTRRIGVLDESYLGTGRPLGVARLLFEVGADGARVNDLRRRLGLDSGYASRLLRRLEDDGLISVERDPVDGRQRVARPTPAGRREQRRLERRSEQLADGIVANLDDRRRAELAAALETARRLLGAATASFDVVDPASDDARRAARRYFDELDERFTDGFDPITAGADADVASFRPPAGAFVLVRADDDVIGCGGVQRVDAATAEIKRMWIDREWRGLGLGRRLLGHLEEVARSLGHRRVVLDTNETLTEALAMYGGAGYRPIERYNDNPYAQHWFTKALVEGG